ncbi:MAG: tRNA adenosine(34) deaminase TadA [Gammaproteobacteria bacterium]|nr:tRNA adenosine(34) deaminase TadA [Gammaproteobacteria bacterium]MCY4217760.1 tRNA adenosine(34) deaminase TadA [Gammaproteobacteria bacterium]MCY4274611.1 tRNA adenosine(34) deaminase TadA [Gammaproteobacteria bacterium]
MSQRKQDIEFMSTAISLAKESLTLGEVPVGALIVKNNKIIGKGYNCLIRTQDPTSHAEIQAIRSAAKTLRNYRLNGCTLYVTLEPCIMCAGAILNARIERVVFAARDQRYGAAGSQLNLLESPFMNHRCLVEGGILTDQSSTMIKAFFEERRA